MTYLSIFFSKVNNAHQYIYISVYVLFGSTRKEKKKEDRYPRRVITNEIIRKSKDEEKKKEEYDVQSG